eukprot:9495920-Alexandrium_andersonii.AAC.1
MWRKRSAAPSSVVRSSLVTGTTGLRRLPRQSMATAAAPRLRKASESPARPQKTSMHRGRVL